jgi:hypothetical protein
MQDADIILYIFRQYIVLFNVMSTSAVKNIRTRELVFNVNIYIKIGRDDHFTKSNQLFDTRF